MLESLKLETLDSIDHIPAAVWDRLMASDVPNSANAPCPHGKAELFNPFNRHCFLSALEQSGCVSAKTGWQPLHLQLSRGDTIIAVIPVYLKSHSYGEYVFDWAWADAYQRHQIEYYPKLVSSIPFTPVAGCRIGIAPELTLSEREQVYQVIRQQLDTYIMKYGLSSWHCLFASYEEHCALAKGNGISRLGVQFHWRNHDYNSFDDFLATMTSRKRKNLRKERSFFHHDSNAQEHVVDLSALPRDCNSHGVCRPTNELSFRFVEGAEITPCELEEFNLCYQMTYAKRSGHQGYLNHSFFEHIVAKMPEQVLLLRVERTTAEANNLVASALFFKTTTHLYGRYWGALETIDGLHFETCYYRGIDYCIAHGLQVFDAGAQGEHKLARGFEPVATYSNHQIAHPEFFQAIKDYTEQEWYNMKEYMKQSLLALPFKKED